MKTYKNKEEQTARGIIVKTENVNRVNSFLIY
jgi:hypothetical protein